MNQIKEFLRSTQGIITSVIAVLVLIPSLINAAIDVFKAIEGVAEQNTDHTDQKVWRGFRREWGLKPESYSEEQINLTFDRNNYIVIGSSTGLVQEGPIDVTRVWDLTGFVEAGYLVLSYITKIDAPITPRGIGTYVLRRSVRDSYVGYRIMKLGDGGKIIKCPYVLSHAGISLDTAKNLWPKHLSQICEELKFNPEETGEPLFVPPSF